MRCNACRDEGAGSTFGSADASHLAEFCGTDQPRDSDNDGGLNALDDAECEGDPRSTELAKELNYYNKLHEQGVVFEPKF